MQLRGRRRHVSCHTLHRQARGQRCTESSISTSRHTSCSKLNSDTLDMRIIGLETTQISAISRKTRDPCLRPRHQSHQPWTFLDTRLVLDIQSNEVENLPEGPHSAMGVERSGSCAKEWQIQNKGGSLSASRSSILLSQGSVILLSRGSWKLVQPTPSTSDHLPSCLDLTRMDLDDADATSQSLNELSFLTEPYRKAMKPMVRSKSTCCLHGSQVGVSSRSSGVPNHRPNRLQVQAEIRIQH